MRGVCLTSARSRWQAASQGAHPPGEACARPGQVYFGLAGATSARAIEVRWPSGQRQIVRGPIPSGQTLTVVESYGDGSVSPATSRPFR